MCACAETVCPRCARDDRRRVLDELIPVEPTVAEERDQEHVQTGTDEGIQAFR